MNRLGLLLLLTCSAIPGGWREQETSPDVALREAEARWPLEPGEYAVVEKVIVASLSSADRKAGGPFVLGLGLDGKPAKGRQD